MNRNQLKVAERLIESGTRKECVRFLVELYPNMGMYSDEEQIEHGEPPLTLEQARAEILDIINCEFFTVLGQI